MNRAEQFAAYLTWLKNNLPPSLAGVSVIGAVIGALVSATLGYSDVWHALINNTQAVEQLRADMRSVDGRLNVHTADQSAFDKRLSVLEAQFKWQADRPDVPRQRPK